MMFSAHRSGYIFLLSVLVIGAVAAASASSLILLGISGQQSSLTVIQSYQAMEFAQSCADQAILALKSDLTYDGGVSVYYTEGSCSIRHMSGNGNRDRGICIEGRSGPSVRRLEVDVEQVLPTTLIRSWTEVSAFTGLCP